MFPGNEGSGIMGRRTDVALLNSAAGIMFKLPPDENGSRITASAFAVKPVLVSTCPAVTFRVVVGSYISLLKTGRPSASVPTWYTNQELKSPLFIAAVGNVILPAKAKLRKRSPS